MPLGGDTAELALTYPRILAPQRALCRPRARPAAGNELRGKMGRVQRCWRDLQVSLEMGVWPHPAGLVLLRAPLPAAGLSQVLVSRPPRTPSPPRQGSLHSSTHPHLPSCPDQCWQLGEDVDRRTDRQTDSCRTPSFIAKCLCSADTGSLHPKPSPLQPWGCRQRFGLCRGRGAWCRAAPAAGRVAQPHRVWG